MRCPPCSFRSVPSAAQRSRRRRRRRDDHACNWCFPCSLAYRLHCALLFLTFDAPATPRLAAGGSVASAAAPGRGVALPDRRNGGVSRSGIQQRASEPLDCLAASASAWLLACCPLQAPSCARQKFVAPMRRVADRPLSLPPPPPPPPPPRSPTAALCNCCFPPCCRHAPHGTAWQQAACSSRSGGAAPGTRGRRRRTSSERRAWAAHAAGWLLHEGCSEGQPFCTPPCHSQRPLPELHAIARWRRWRPPLARPCREALHGPVPTAAPWLEQRVTGEGQARRCSGMHGPLHDAWLAAPGNCMLLRGIWAWPASLPQHCPARLLLLLLQPREQAAAPGGAAAAAAAGSGAGARASFRPASEPLAQHQHLCRLWPGGAAPGAAAPQPAAAAAAAAAAGSEGRATASNATAAAAPAAAASAAVAAQPAGACCSAGREAAGWRAAAQRARAHPAAGCWAGARGCGRRRVAGWAGPCRHAAGSQTEGGG